MFHDLPSPGSRFEFRPLMAPRMHCREGKKGSGICPVLLTVLSPSWYKDPRVLPVPGTAVMAPGGADRLSPQCPPVCPPPPLSRAKDAQNPNPGPPGFLPQHSPSLKAPPQHPYEATIIPLTLLISFSYYLTVNFGYLLCNTEVTF